MEELWLLNSLEKDKSYEMGKTQARAKVIMTQGMGQSSTYGDTAHRPGQSLQPRRARVRATHVTIQDTSQSSIYEYTGCRPEQHLW